MNGMEWGLAYVKRDILVNRIEDYLSKFRSIIMTARVCLCMSARVWKKQEMKRVKQRANLIQT